MEGGILNAEGLRNKVGNKSFLDTSASWSKLRQKGVSDNMVEHIVKTYNDKILCEVRR
jgi:hypothetical protein